MRVDREGFGHEISAIEGARNEAYTKQILAYTVTDPVYDNTPLAHHKSGPIRLQYHALVPCLASALNTRK